MSPTRRQLFKAGGASTAGVLASVSLGAGSAQAQTISFFNVRDYGASPTASPAANVAAFQAAVDDAAAAPGPGRVFVPAGTYETDKFIRMRSHVALQGERQNASWIKNVSTGTSASKMTILLGNYGTVFLDGVFYSIQPASKNDTTITFATASDAANFSVGDIIVLQSEEGFRNDNRPEFQEINEVVRVGNGIVALKYALHDNLGGANPKVQRSGDPSRAALGETAEIVKGAQIRDLTLSSNGNWMVLGARLNVR